MRNLPDEFLWSREETDNTAGNIQAKLVTEPELWTKLGRNAKLNEKQKWSHEKLHLDNARKNCEGSISSTRRTRNLRRPSRMLARNWKHQVLTNPNPREDDAKPNSLNSRRKLRMVLLEQVSFHSSFTHHPDAAGADDRRQRHEVE